MDHIHRPCTAMENLNNIPRISDIILRSLTNYLRSRCGEISKIHKGRRWQGVFDVRTVDGALLVETRRLPPRVPHARHLPTLGAHARIQRDRGRPVTDHVSLNPLRLVPDVVNGTNVARARTANLPKNRK